jgi:hypothetical protein
VNPKGVTDGKLVNIPAPTSISMGRRGSERSGPIRNSALKPVDISVVGKSATDVEGDSTTKLRLSG